MKALSIGIFALALTGCSTLMPQLQTPQLSIVNVELGESTLWQQRLKVRMHVQNPNDRALPIKGLSYELEVNGQDFANGVSAASFTVPAMGEADFDMNITANVASSLIKLLGKGSDPLADKLDYRLKGKISLASGLLRSIPFEERGTFNLR